MLKQSVAALCLVLAAHATQAQPFVRPGEELTFTVASKTVELAPGKVIGRLRGMTATMFDSPCGSCEMGKRMIVDKDDNVYFLMTREDKVMKIAADNKTMTEYMLPAGSGPYSVGIDSKGILWLSAHGIEMLLELDPQTRKISTHAPKSHGFLVHVNVNPKDDTVFFVQPGANKVVSFTRQAGFREYDVPTPQAGPARLDFDSQGNVWFPELYQNKLAKLEPATGKFTEWDLPTEKGFPAYVRVDKRDHIWISQPMKDKLVVFNRKQFREYDIPTRNSIVSTNEEDRNGLVWMTQGGWRGSAGGNKVAVLDPATGAVEELAIPLKNSQPAGLVITRSGDIWFQLTAKGRVVRLRADKTEVAKK